SAAAVCRVLARRRVWRRAVRLRVWHRLARGTRTAAVDAPVEGSPGFRRPGLARAGVRLHRGFAGVVDVSDLPGPSTGTRANVAVMWVAECCCRPVGDF